MLPCRAGGSTSMCLSCYYLGLMDALYPICPDCLFIGEGTGATSLAANWGGSVTSRTDCGYYYQDNAQQACQHGTQRLLRRRQAKRQTDRQMLHPWPGE